MKKRRYGRRRAWRAFGIFLIAAAMFVFMLPRVAKYIFYPVKYQQEIGMYANLYGIDPALITAIVHTESGFDPAATSPYGARGLMQIMPDTGEWIHGKFTKDAPFYDDMLYAADVSLKYGTWYLDFLIDRYDGEYLPAVAAYHAGQGAVDGWLLGRDPRVDGRTMDMIPDKASSTRHYVEKVYKAYEYYKEVIGQ